MFPENIAGYIKDRTYELNPTGQSGASVMIFDDMVLKIEPESADFEAMIAMLRWLEGRLPAPRVICAEKSGGMQYLLMTKAEGEMLCSESSMRDIENTVGLYAEALKMLWNTDITGCPRVIRLDDELRAARYNLEHGHMDVEDCEPETFGPGGFENPEQLLEWLENNRPQEEQVLSHGDLCMPNVFVQDGKVSCYIDIGGMGVGDKWRDIALCWRSLKHNCTGKYARENLGDQTELLFEKLGIAPDWEKIRYYILLDEFF